MIRFKIIPGWINKIPEFYTIFARKMPDYIIRQRDRGQAKAKCLRPRPRPNLWGGGQNFGLEVLTSLLTSKFYCNTRQYWHLNSELFLTFLSVHQSPIRLLLVALIPLGLRLALFRSSTYLLTYLQSSYSGIVIYYAYDWLITLSRCNAAGRR